MSAAGHGLSPLSFSAITGMRRPAWRVVEAEWPGRRGLHPHLDVVYPHGPALVGPWDDRVATSRAAGRAPLVALRDPVARGQCPCAPIMSGRAGRNRTGDLEGPITLRLRPARRCGRGVGEGCLALYRLSYGPPVLRVLRTAKWMNPARFERATTRLRFDKPPSSARVVAHTGEVVSEAGALTTELRVHPYRRRDSNARPPGS